MREGKKKSRQDRGYATGGDFLEEIIKAADAHASSAFLKWKFFVFRFCRRRRHLS